MRDKLSQALGVAAVGGRCLEATAAGGATGAGREVEGGGDGGREGGNKERQQNAADELKKKHILPQINEATEQLDIWFVMFVQCVCFFYQRKEAWNSASPTTP